MFDWLTGKKKDKEAEKPTLPIVYDYTIGRDLAIDLGHRGMWVLTEATNAAALRTYRSAGADGSDGAVVLEWRFDIAP